mgnify:FL=1
MQVILIVLISLLLSLIICISIYLFVREIKATDKDKKRRIIGKRRNRKYVDFVNEHSLAIRAIKELNSKYQFSPIYPLIYKNCYDTTVNFEKVSCKDYLIYQFHLDTLRVRRIIKSRNNNISKEIDYKSKVDLAKDKLGNFDVSIEDLNEEKMRNIESIVFNDLIEKVNTDFYAEVHLYLTRGRMHRVIDEKKESFDLNEIIDALKSIDSSKLKEGRRFYSAEVWNSIERVERAKVSNELRQEIFERDGYTCVNCGSTEKESLEIDHIQPISKGGKTEPGNLQTLCHDCNFRKGNNIDL